MRFVWLLAGVICAPCQVWAQAAPGPRLTPQDTWSYQVTDEGRTGWRQIRGDSTVVRVGGAGVLLSDRQSGSTMPPVEHLVAPDFSITRSVNGRETVVNRPFAFPLSAGKTWDVDFTETNPNRHHSSEHIHDVFRVVGAEDVTVPAGTFHAIKIEADGQWTATIAPSVTAAGGARVDAQGATTVLQTNRVGPGVITTGKFYKAFWYAPNVKRQVKSVEETYDTNGVRTESHTMELTAWKIAP